MIRLVGVNGIEGGKIMPWKPKDALSHTKKANTPEKQSLWSRIANQALRKGASDGSAIRQANAAIKRIGK